MRQFLILTVAISCVALAGCGDGGGGGGGAATIAGTYALDTAVVEQAMLDAAKKEAGGVLPDAMKEQISNMIKAQAEQIKMECTIKADGTFSIVAAFGEKQTTATGTWKLDGDKLSMTGLTEDGKDLAEDKQETKVGTYANGTIRVSQEGVPFEFVLEKK
jgi:hypothetical protein